MKLGIAQLDTRAGDFSRTGERIVAYTEQAAAQGVDLLVFPVTTLMGALPVPFAEQNGLFIDLADLIVTLCDRVACPCILPLVTAFAGETLPEVFLIAQGDALPLRFSSYMSSLDMGSLDMHSLTEQGSSSNAGVSVVDEQAGTVPTSFEFGGMHITLAFDYEDLELLTAGNSRTDVILFLPYRGFSADDPASALGSALIESGYPQDARTAASWLVAAGSLGCYDTQIFTGGSFVLTPRGELAASAPSFEEALLTAEIDAEARFSGEVLEPEIYNGPFFRWEALTLGLRDFVHKLDKQDVALPLDGTLSSLVLAALASDALGPTHVHALLATPLQGVSATYHRAAVLASWQALSSAADRIRSCRQLAAHLHLDLHERGARLLEATAASLESAYTGDDLLQALTCEAGVIHAELMALARASDSLLISPRDKTWLAVEAHTGAASADILPFGDVFRSDILDMARVRNAISPIIPDATLASCDLPAIAYAHDQLLPEAYLQALDRVLASRIEEGHTITETLADQGDEDLVCAVLSAFNACGGARASAGPVLILSSLSLDEERRPFGLAWQDRPRSAEELPDPTDLVTAMHDLDSLREMGERLQGEAGEEEGQATRTARRARPDAANLLAYLRDLMEGLDTGTSGSAGHGPFDGHVAADGEGHLSFGGFGSMGASPFSEN